LRERGWGIKYKSVGETEREGVCGAGWAGECVEETQKSRSGDDKTEQRSEHLRTNLKPKTKQQQQGKNVNKIPKNKTKINRKGKRY
jgi:hypothetical protein